MKRVTPHAITNISDTPQFDRVFCFEYLTQPHPPAEVGHYDMTELLSAYKNTDILEKVSQKPAMWSEVYSPKDELKIFEDLYETALKTKQKIHISGITL